MSEIEKIRYKANEMIDFIKLIPEDNTDIILIKNFLINLHYRTSYLEKITAWLFRYWRIETFI